MMSLSFVPSLFFQQKQDRFFSPSVPSPRFLFQPQPIQRPADILQKRSPSSSPHFSGDDTIKINPIYTHQSVDCDNMPDSVFTSHWSGARDVEEKAKLFEARYGDKTLSSDEIRRTSRVLFPDNDRDSDIKKHWAYNKALFRFLGLFHLLKDPSNKKEANELIQYMGRDRDTKAAYNALRYALRTQKEERVVQTLFRKRLVVKDSENAMQAVNDACTHPEDLKNLLGVGLSPKVVLEKLLAHSDKPDVIKDNAYLNNNNGKSLLAEALEIILKSRKGYFTAAQLWYPHTDEKILKMLETFQELSKGKAEGKWALLKIMEKLYNRSEPSDAEKKWVALKKDILSNISEKDLKDALKARLGLPIEKDDPFTPGDQRILAPKAREALKERFGDGYAQFIVRALCEYFLPEAKQLRKTNIAQGTKSSGSSALKLARGLAFNAISQHPMEPGERTSFMQALKVEAKKEHAARKITPFWRSVRLSQLAQLLKACNSQLKLIYSDITPERSVVWNNTLDSIEQSIKKHGLSKLKKKITSAPSDGKAN